jgi:hypothetical protein
MNSNLICMGVEKFSVDSMYRDLIQPEVQVDNNKNF